MFPFKQMATGPFWKAGGLLQHIHAVSLLQDPSSGGPGSPLHQEALDLEVTLGLEDG